MGNLCKSLLKVEGQPGNKVPTRAAEKLIQTIQATTSYIQQTTMNIHFFFVVVSWLVKATVDLPIAPSPNVSSFRLSISSLSWAGTPGWNIMEIQLL